jgi:hypothetical protein
MLKYLTSTSSVSTVLCILVVILSAKQHHQAVFNTIMQLSAANKCARWRHLHQCKVSITKSKGLTYTKVYRSNEAYLIMGMRNDESTKAVFTVFTFTRINAGFHAAKLV